MAQCTQSEFKIAFHFSRRVVANFDEGTHSSDAGPLLSRELASKLKIFPRLAQCFTDFRSQDHCEHGVEKMLAQRVLSLAMSDEDLNDHDQLGHHPLLALAADKRDADPLASRSTLLQAGSCPQGRLRRGPLQADRPRPEENRPAAGGVVCPSPQRAARGNRTRSGCDRYGASWPSEGPLLSGLPWPLLLPAAVHLQWPTFAVRGARWRTGSKSN